MFLTEFHGTVTAHVNAPAADVFDLLVDVDRLPEWNEHVHHVSERPEGPLTEGAEWVIQMRAMGTRWPSRSRALTVDKAGLLFEHRSCSDDGNPSYALWSWQLVPTEDGSTLTVSWAAHPATFWRRLLLARARRPGLANEVRASLAGLSDYLSGSAAVMSEVHADGDGTREDSDKSAGGQGVRRREDQLGISAVAKPSPDEPGNEEGDDTQEGRSDSAHA